MNMFFTYTVIFIGLFTYLSQTFAQGISSSRYDADPISLNPSLTGDFNGGWRVTLNYDETKTLGTPFKNYMMAYDRPVYVKSHKFGFGITALHDETGNNVFNKEKVFISGTYFTRYKKFTFIFGTQAGYVHSNIKLGDEIWPDQYNRMLGIFEPNLGSGENMNKNVSYFDLNTGISCKINLPQINPQFGISVHHLNAPKIQYTSVSTQLKQVFTLHGSANWLMNQKIYITPTFIYKTNFGENYMVYGASCSYKFAGSFLEKSIFTGLDVKNSYHQMSAISIFGGLRYNQWQFGASYDYNLSKSGFAINGPLEIYIRYTALSSRIQNFSMPCSRF